MLQYAQQRNCSCVFARSFGSNCQYVRKESLFGTLQSNPTGRISGDRRWSMAHQQGRRNKPAYDTQMLLSLVQGRTMGRETAARMLEKVADDGSCGCWPPDVTAEQLGHALYRIAMNAPEEDPLRSILKGWRDAHEKNSRPVNIA